MTLYDLATVIRSKNAGPFTLTIDLIFASEEDMDAARKAPDLAPDRIARLYNVPASAVVVHELRQARALKITLPRHVSSGSARDRDVYGSQQHMPLGRVSLDRPCASDA